MTPDERAELVELWRQRQALMRAEGDMVRRTKALARRAGLALDDPHIIAASEPFLEAAAVLHASKLRAERRLRKLARTDPVWNWASQIRGLAELGVASVLAEAGGDLRTYSTHSKLWKRFGLAVSDDGLAQGRRGGAQALLEGFSPQRRNVIHNVAIALLRAQSPTVGPYRQVYDQRKIHEISQVSSPAHAEARAVRYMTKRVLRDLWLAARVTPPPGL